MFAVPSAKLSLVLATGVAGCIKIQGGDRLHLVVGLGETAVSFPLDYKADLLAMGISVSAAVWSWRLCSKN